MRNRWLQLGLGILAMVMIANLQYGWAQFVPPMVEANHWGKAAVQWAFTLFVLTETFLVPIEGYLIDRIGPRPMVAIGGMLVGAAWLIDGAATSLGMLYAGAVVGGIGAGIVYGTAVGNALKWFPDRRGLAAGLTAAGFGAGAALTVVPIANMIASVGYRATFTTFGWIQGAIVVAVALFLVKPPIGAGASDIIAGVRSTLRNFTPAQMLRTPSFYLLYAMLVMVATGGLLITAQLGVLATDFGIAKTPVSLAGITLAALPFALTLDRILNGLSRPAFGALSDRIGRENTMFIAFILQGVAIGALLLFAKNPVVFVLLTGFMFFTAGEIYSLFPATSGDLYGRAYATTNYGLLYTGKGVASFVVPIGSLITAATGSWVAIFVVVMIFNVVTAVLALVALKPLRKRALANESTAADTSLGERNANESPREAIA